MADKGEVPFEIQTLIKVLAPDELGVTLVVLSDIEQAELSLFWSSIFLSVFAALLGSSVSLLLTDYSNKPVIGLLAVFVVVFLGLFAVFAYNGFMRRKTARRRRTTRGKATEAISGTESERDYKELDASRVIGIVYRILYTLREQIFTDTDQLSLEDFEKRWGDLVAVEFKNIGEQDRGVIRESLFTTGILKLDDADPAETIIRFDSAFKPERYWKALVHTA